ncbi:secreted and transmembrane protein 1-like [Perognathus longimembris pacificus]|uniref:secreted and transmembrane protein 1-like n=1 Tax=Perognathus longimembris pacificus TaxID=214514 RepID=UPI00201A072D|nr:secreted and transmembrane protein 1-like [Perognathus longimembris pacificus]XP_048222573.1 secreted and transmembrane protein 1-like [Perognathus longimembris pacificus]
MPACPRAGPGPGPRVLGALLLLAATLGAPNERWDDPACTEGVVSVSRGQRAVMTCNISNPFTHVTVRLRTPGVSRTVFSEDTPGRFSQDGWQLLVQGGQAQLVIGSARDSHAGLYSWCLRGQQLNHRSVSLNVLEPQDQELATGPGQAAASEDPTPRVPQLRSTRASRGPRSRGGVLATVLIFTLVAAALGLLSWYRPCPS